MPRKGGEGLSPIEQAWERYKAAERAYDAAEKAERAAWGPPGRMEPQRGKAWDTANSKLMSASRAKFGAYDFWHTLKKKRDKELWTLIRDGIAAGVEDLPIFQNSVDRMTTEMTAFLVNTEQVNETDLSPAPLCDGCREEMLV